MPLRLGNSLPGYRNARASSSSRPLISAAIRELPFSSTSRAQEEDSSPPKLEGFTVSNTAHQNIDEVSRRGLDETRSRTAAQNEARKQARRQIDHDKHSPAGNDQTSTQSRRGTSYQAPSIPADPFAAPAPPASHPGRGQSSGRRSLLDRVKGDADLNPTTVPRQPQPIPQAATLSADPFDALLHSGRVPEGSSRRPILDRVADDLFENPPETSHPAQQHPERGAPGQEAQRRGGYDYRGRGDGHRPDDARGGRAEDGGPSRGFYSNGPMPGGPYMGGRGGFGPRGGRGGYQGGPGRGGYQGGPGRGGYLGGPGRGGYQGGSPRGGYQGGPGRPMMRAGPGGPGGARGGRGRGRGRGGNFSGKVYGLGELAEEEIIRRQIEHVVRLPPPRGPVNDQSFVGLFGRLSVINPPVKGASHPEKEWWAQGMTPIDARKSEVLRLAGSYDTLIPNTPHPSDPSLENNPKEKAKAAYIWTTSLHPGVGMEVAKVSVDKVATALQ